MFYNRQINHHYVIEQDRYKDYTYTICLIDSGWFTCYIDVTDTPLKYLAYTSIDLNVHYGLTYGSAKYPWESESKLFKKRWIIGWDYAHFDDAIEPEIVKFIFNTDSYKSYGDQHHTLQELRLDCFNAIDEIREKYMNETS